MEIIAIIILLLALWLSINYALLKGEHYSAEKAFEHIYKIIKAQYGEVQEFLDLVKTNSAQKELIDETLGYITKALGFSIEKDGNERIIGYANAISENTKKIKTEIASKENLDENIKNVLGKYESALNNFNKEKDAYNLTAKRLRHYLDVFPTSFMARLQRITTIDYLK